MSKKKNILTILENQVDKIVLGIMALISLVLLWMFVLGNPYGQKIKIGSRETRVNPGNIDRKLNADAEKLLAALEQPPKASEYDVYNQSNLDDYTAKIQCAVADVPTDLPVPYPGVGETGPEEDRLYAMPMIPAITNVQEARLRGAAQVPVEEVSPGMPYESVETKLEDIDFVTVSGHFDVERLYNNFQLSFAGPGLKSSWRDSKLATPVLARIELQRRVQSEDGSYGSWQVVPRAKIDGYKKLLEQLPLKADQMQFGVDVWISQYQSPDVQLDILQPKAYQFGRSKLEWMPPEYLKEMEELIQHQKEQERRELIESRRKSRENEQQRNTNRPGATERRSTRRPAMGRGETRGGREELMGEVNPRERATARRTERDERDIERDIQNVTLKSTARLENTREPITVWAHDDTVEPGKTYEYRIRIGVFNPIMGKDWFLQDQLEFKGQTVLWSDFSEPTELIEVPKMLHVFPTDPITVTQDDGSKSIEGVKVEVAKYYMGQWQSHEFEVYPGQPIGSVAEEEPEDTTTQPADGFLDLRGGMGMMETTQMGPVDYSSGMTVVDVVTQVAWDARMRRTNFYNMLYYDSFGLQELGIGRSNWPGSIRSAYDDVQDAMEEDIETRTRSIDGMRAPGRLGRDDMEIPIGL